MRSGAFRAIAVAALVAAFAGLIAFEVDHAARNRGLPLGYVAVIREQAAEKHVDPALIAAVIYAETKFDPRPSAAGAEGLMQILPATAYFIAGLSGGRQFTAGDLATPSINVAYGSYYLRYLLDHYSGNEMLAVAAYNAGISNVDAWIASARAEGARLDEGTIPFAETREYVQRVLGAERDYRTTDARALGLA
jgi:soluble lytic murein transglycosylase